MKKLYLGCYSMGADTLWGLWMTCWSLSLLNGRKLILSTAESSYPPAYHAHLIFNPDQLPEAA